jgi:hypothetical protein
MHGGKTPKGPDSPHWKHGRDASEKPPTLAEQHAMALADPELMRYRHDAALLEALRRNLTVRLNLDRAVPAAVEKRLLDITDNLRRVKEAEQRRLQQLALMVPLDQHRRAMTLAADIVVRVLGRNTERLRTALEAAGVDGKLVALVDPMAWQREMQHEMRLAAMRAPAIVIDADTGGWIGGNEEARRRKVQVAEMAAVCLLLVWLLAVREATNRRKILALVRELEYAKQALRDTILALRGLREPMEGVQ